MADGCDGCREDARLGSQEGRESIPMARSGNDGRAPEPNSPVTLTGDGERNAVTITHQPRKPAPASKNIGRTTSANSTREANSPATIHGTETD